MFTGRRADFNLRIKSVSIAVVLTKKVNEDLSLDKPLQSHTQNQQISL
jgi:hypothetical protein